MAHEGHQHQMSSVSSVENGSHTQAPSKSPTVIAQGAYTAAPRPGVPNLAIYISQIRNQGDTADQLLSASTDIARTTELHEMKMDGEMMHMRQVSAIDIPARSTVDMSKGAGYHLMVMGVSRPLKAGDSFPVTLVFLRAGRQVIDVQVKDLSTAAGGHVHHQGHDMHMEHHHEQ
ncbi:MAG: copper chaperone PCu(A)C [Lautropia sp.]|nr:copper chaperone PCu(A)C [Lautropia sp.]